MTLPALSFDVLEPEPLMVVVSGPSGVGKDSVVRLLMKRMGSLHFVVTATSRARRENEVDGVDYIFMEQEEFQRKIANDEFIEHAWVYDHFKGIPKTNIRSALRSKQDVILRLDVQGAATIRKLYPEAVLVFLSPCNPEELIHRLIDRGTETAESIAIRMETSRKELDQISIFDYVVTNPEGHIEQAVEDLQAILTAEHLRVHPRKVNV